MTSISTSQAHAQWLGISPSESPAHHYRLLGIAIYESDPQTIVQACAQRTAQVSAHLGGPQADAARALLGELAAAQACLLDPKAKLAYDEKLRIAPSNGKQAAVQPAASAGSSLKRPAPRASNGNTPSAAPIAMGAAAAGKTTAAATPPPTGENVEPPTPAKDYAPRGETSEPLTALPWLIGGVCAGLLGVAVLAMILFGPGRRDRTPVAGNDTNLNERGGDGQHPNETSGEVDKRRRDGRSPRDDRRRDDAQGGVMAPVSKSPDSLTWDQDPDIETGGDLLRVDDINDPATTVGAPDDSSSTTGETVDGDNPPAAPAARLASLPKAVALSPRGAAGAAATTGGPVMLTRVDIDDARDVQLQLIGNHLAGGTGRFELAPIPDDESPEGGRTWEVKHVSDENPAASVGQYRLADGELSFEWSPEADKARYTQLANEPLRITAGDQTATIAQRVAQEVAPLMIKVDAGAVGTSVPVENPPENADLVVSIDELGEAFGEYSWEPNNTIEVGKTTYLRFGAENDRFQFALQVTAERDGRDKVRVETRPMFRQSGAKRWDYFRPTKTAQLLGTMQQQQALMDAQLQDIQRLYRRDQAARDRATAIHNQQSAALLENIANLERISDRCQELQEDGQLHFRVYADSGDAQIDLVRTAASEKDQPQEPVDENIGPPVDPNIGPPVEDGGEPE